MEWSAGRCRLTVALLLVLLELRHALAVAPAGADAGRKKSLAGGCPLAREAYCDCSDEDVVARASTQDDDTRISARGGSFIRSYDENKLKIAVPHKHGFQVFVNITHPNTRGQKVTGYSIDVFKAALGRLKNPPQYDFWDFNGTYDELVRNVSTGVYDAAVGDVTITAQRVEEAEFTMPYKGSGLSALVRPENDWKQIKWIFLEPLTMQLWIATLCGFYFTGFVVWMIEHPRNPEYQGSRLKQLSNASYFAFSTLTFSHEKIIRSSLSKVVLVVWCFALLILVQSYAANLSSMLTATRIQASVMDLNNLVQRGEIIGYQEGAFVHSFLQDSYNVPEKQLRGLKDHKEYATALKNGSRNGGVSAIVDEIPYLTHFILKPQYKKEFEMVKLMYNYWSPGLGFVFPLGSSLVHNLSIAILELIQFDEVSDIETRWLGSAARTTADDKPVADFAPLTLQSFSGLFVITGCVSTLMLLIQIARSVYTKYTRVRGSGLQHSIGEDGGSTNLRESSALPEGFMSYGSALDESHSEDMSEHSIRAHGSRVGVGQEEPCRIHNGSVPADAVQIEMSSAEQGVGLAP